MSTRTTLRLPCTVGWTILATACVLALAGVGAVVYNKHFWLEGQLATIEPRFARLTGLNDAQAQIADALQRAQAVVQRHAHVSELDSTQLGNDILSRVKQVLVAARFDVGSTQVLVEGEHAGYEKITLVIKGEGDINSLMGALSGIYEQTPSIVLDSFSVQSTGFATQYAPQRVGAQFSLFVLRGKK